MALVCIGSDDNACVRLEQNPQLQHNGALIEVLCHCKLPESAQKRYAGSMGIGICILSLAADSLGFGLLRFWSLRNGPQARIDGSMIACLPGGP